MSNVERLVREVWAARKDGRLTRDERLLAQQVYVAAAADVAANAGYDPETDRRVEWLREVTARVRRHERPEAEAVLEALVEWLVFRERAGRDAVTAEREERIFH